MVGIVPVVGARVSLLPNLPDLPDCCSFPFLLERGFPFDDSLIFCLLLNEEGKILAKLGGGGVIGREEGIYFFEILFCFLHLLIVWIWKGVWVYFGSLR